LFSPSSSGQAAAKCPRVRPAYPDQIAYPYEIGAHQSVVFLFPIARLFLFLTFSLCGSPACARPLLIVAHGVSPLVAENHTGRLKFSHDLSIKAEIYLSY
jgi:hypothetical protein